MSAALSTKMHLLLERVQRVERRVNHQINVSTTTAIAAGWATSGYIFLPAERNYPVTTVTCFYMNSCLIKEHTLHCNEESAKEQKQHLSLDNYSAFKVRSILQKRPRMKRIKTLEIKLEPIQSTPSGA